MVLYTPYVYRTVNTLSANEAAPSAVGLSPCQFGLLLTHREAMRHTRTFVSACFSFLMFFVRQAPSRLFPVREPYG